MPPFYIFVKALPWERQTYNLMKKTKKICSDSSIGKQKQQQAYIPFVIVLVRDHWGACTNIHKIFSQLKSYTSFTSCRPVWLCNTLVVWETSTCIMALDTLFSGIFWMLNGMPSMYGIQTAKAIDCTQIPNTKRVSGLYKPRSFTPVAACFHRNGYPSPALGLFVLFSFFCLHFF